MSALFRWIVRFNKWFVTSVFCNKASLALFSKSERILLSRRCVTWLCLHRLSNDGLGSTKVSLERPDYLSCGGVYPSFRQAPLVSHDWQLFTSQSVDEHFEAQPTTLMKWEQSGSRIATTGHQNAFTWPSSIQLFATMLQDTFKVPRSYRGTNISY